MEARQLGDKVQLRGWSRGVNNRAFVDRIPDGLVAGSLVLSLALAAWLSQLPYFLWSVWQIPMVIGGLLTGTAAVLAVWVRRGEGLERRDILAMLCLAAFVIYISIQKTVDGGHSLWIFVLPTLFALAVARLAEKARALRCFELIFLISLIPGVLYLTLMIVGAPLTFSVIPAKNAGLAAAGVRMLELPGAVFFERNSQPLPWGGVISRLCGMFDEPGMVGTIAALLLASYGFRLGTWRQLALYVVGTLSLSLAFIVLFLVGVVFRLYFRRDWKAALCGVPVLLSGLFVVGIIELPRAPSEAVRARVMDVPVASGAAAASQPDAPRAVAPPLPETESIRVEGARVRQLEQINNRSQPGMDRLFERYLQSDWMTLTFGIASDAATVYGGASAIWFRVLTNHGIVGFVLLCVPLLAYGWSGMLRVGDRFVMFIFLASYALSFYQRPVIWVPYCLVVFFGAVCAVDRDHRPARPFREDVGIESSGRRTP